MRRFFSLGYRLRIRSQRATAGKDDPFRPPRPILFFMRGLCDRRERQRKLQATGREMLIYFGDVWDIMLQELLFTETYTLHEVGARGGVEGVREVREQVVGGPLAGGQGLHVKACT